MNNTASEPQIFTATTTTVNHLASDYYQIRFTLKSPDFISFFAGQYISFHVGPPKMRHPMSIISPPQTGDAIEILQDASPGGQGSKWALQLKAGDEVQFTGPLGKFTVHKESNKKKVFIATGCGIAPFRSMILDYLSAGTATVALYWGLRHESDLFWQDEWKQLEKQYPSFTYHPALSQPQNGWQGQIGHVTDYFIAEEKDLENSEFYLCGNRGMIVDTRKFLTEHAVAEEAIFTEFFNVLK